MNKNLLDLIEKYTRLSHKDVSVYLNNLSKDNIIAILIDLLTMYFNDKNSSTLRQYVVAVASGYEPNFEKLGYNGYRQSALSNKIEHCEVKPKNINTNDKNPKKLDGRGNFTDYTFARLKKDKKDSPQMLVAGFIDGKLIYIFSFPFKSKSFVDKLESQLKSKYPNGDENGKYLRSASFGLSDYKNIKDLKVNIFRNKKELEKDKNHISRDLYNLLLSNVR